MLPAAKCARTAHIMLAANVCCTRPVQQKATLFTLMRIATPK